MSDQDNKLFEYLFTISRFMRGEVASDFKKQHLTLLQLQALIFIKDRGEAQMQEIAEHFKVAKPTATTLLSNLDKLGLIQRLGDTKDRRIVKVTLSIEGERMFKQVLKYKKEKIKTLLSYLPKTDKADLIRIMATLAEKIANKIE